jgi:protein-tyrosine phosphatase
MTVHVLFVCLGNICRSPTAEGIFTRQVIQAGLSDRIRVDSAGTADWHVGRAPDTRTVAAAHARGYDLSNLRARQVAIKDFTDFDYILAMDNANLTHLRAMIPSDYAGHLGLFLEFSASRGVSEVPDPYYGGNDGFEQVLVLVEEAAQGLLQHILQHHR